VTSIWRKNVYWVPKEARWSFIRDFAKQSSIGTIIDNAYGGAGKGQH